MLIMLSSRSMLPKSVSSYLVVEVQRILVSNQDIVTNLATQYNVALCVCSPQIRDDTVVYSNRREG